MRRGIKNDLKILTWAVGRLEVPFPKMGSLGWGVPRRGGAGSNV